MTLTSFILCSESEHRFPFSIFHAHTSLPVVAKYPVACSLKVFRHFKVIASSLPLRNVYFINLINFWHAFRNLHPGNRTARIILNPSVILVETGKGHPPEVTKILEANGFQVLPCRSIFDLEKLCHQDDLGAVIVDLDDPLLNNRVLREVKRKRPALQIIGISSWSFHPDLKEAMANHIYASLNKPVDPDQLIYLVKGILCTATSSK